MISTISSEQALEEINYLIENMSDCYKTKKELETAINLLAQYDKDITIKPEAFLKLLYYSPLKAIVRDNLVELKEFEWLRDRYSNSNSSERNTFYRLLQQHDEEKSKNLPWDEFIGSFNNRITRYNYSTIKRRIQSENLENLKLNLVSIKNFIDKAHYHYSEFTYQKKLTVEIIKRIKGSDLFNLENLPSIELGRLAFSTEKLKNWKEYIDLIDKSSFIKDNFQYYYDINSYLNKFHSMWDCECGAYIESSEKYFHQINFSEDFTRNTSLIRQSSIDNFTAKQLKYMKQNTSFQTLLHSANLQEP